MASKRCSLVVFDSWVQFKKNLIIAAILFIVETVLVCALWETLIPLADLFNLFIILIVGILFVFFFSRAIHEYGIYRYFTRPRRQKEKKII